MSDHEASTYIEHPPSATGGARGGPRPHQVVLLVLGVLLSVFGLVVTGAAASLGAAVLMQRGGGFIESPSERYAVETYAITSQELDVVLDRGMPSAGRGPLASFVLRATSATPGQNIFVGIGPQTDVTEYLTGVEHSEVTDIRFNPFDVRYRTVPGSAEPALPADQDFWVVSAQGPGTQQVTSDLRSGNWAVSESPCSACWWSSLGSSC